MAGIIMLENLCLVITYMVLVTICPEPNIQRGRRFQLWSQSFPVGMEAIINVEKVDCCYLIEGVKVSLVIYDIFQKCIDVDVSVGIISNSA